ncbi:hypothetical protein [Hymenobacter frigidus]|uniref:hypothetical protein n=1 Tax=Hymenobacter frigidus TaxID=1524095 RepID=UPI001E53DBD2|nr:hypothetical protein [Hymenobacter frigidus]
MPQVAVAQLPRHAAHGQRPLAQQALGRFHALPDDEMLQAKAFGGGKHVAQVGKPPLQLLAKLPRKVAAAQHRRLGGQQVGDDFLDLGHQPLLRLDLFLNAAP